MTGRVAIIGVLAALAGGGADPSGCGLVIWRRHGQPAHGFKGAPALVRAVGPLVPFTIGP